jgi:hypothetical protein
MVQKFFQGIKGDIKEVIAPPKKALVVVNEETGEAVEQAAIAQTDDVESDEESEDMEDAAPEDRGVMRALPVDTGRRCAEANGLAPVAPLVLVAEMEFFDPQDAGTGQRLKAYEKAGFKKADPRLVAYHQPDFRAPEQIDATGGATPLPFQLVLRRVGREGESTMSGKELRTVVSALRALYAEQLRPEDMAHPALSLEGYPGEDVRIELLAPAEGVPN